MSIPDSLTSRALAGERLLADGEERVRMCVNALAHVPAGILENMPGKRYLLTFDTIEEAEKLIQMFKDHEEDQ